MSTARKIFSARVVLPANTPSSLYTLMKNSALHWGYETTGLTTPSLDSITGSNAIVTPDANVDVGSDSNVRNTSGGGFYKGVTALGGEPFSLQDFGDAFGVIDPNAIFFYNQSGCNMDVVFTGR